MKRYNVLKDGKKTFNYCDAAVGEFVYIILENLIIMLLSVILALGAPRTVGISYVFSAIIEVGFVAAVLIAARSSRTSVFAATKLNKKITWKQAGFVVIISILALFGYNALTNSFVNFFELIGYSSSASIDVSSWGIYILFVFTMAIVPAFCEELLFRGLVYQGLRKWSEKGAVFVSAALFMLMHGSPDQTIHQFILGVILAYVVYATGSIWASMLLHFLNNFIALTISFAYSQMGIGASDAAVETAKLTWSSWFISILTGLVAAAFVSYIIYEIIKYLKKDREKKEAAKEAAAAEAVQNAEPKAVEPVAQVVEGEAVEPIPVEKYSGELSENIEDPEDSEVLSPRSKKVAIVLFSLAGAWLVFEWISALISGIIK